MFSFYDNFMCLFLFYLNKFLFLIQCIDDWEKFNEIGLPEIQDFYSNLNMEDIPDADYMDAKRVCKAFQIKDLGQYHDLYV